jgi:DNA-binding GntR family transcriptional regulator
MHDGPPSDSGLHARSTIHRRSGGIVRSKPPDPDALRCIPIAVPTSAKIRCQPGQLGRTARSLPKQIASIRLHLMSAGGFALETSYTIWLAWSRRVRSALTLPTRERHGMALEPLSDTEAISDTALQRKPQRTVLADDVYDILRDSLVSQRIAPGARLNLDELARKLHVSNTPVRQALARLESDGLVTKEPYRGFAASRLLDSRTIIELYEYRLLIEPATAARAARKRTDAEGSELERACAAETIDPLLSDPVRLGDLPQLDVDFHCTVASQAGNRVVLENLTQLMTRMSLYSGYGHAGAAELAWEEHRAIAAAIRDGEAEAAATAMRVHLTSGLDRMRKAVG